MRVKTPSTRLTSSLQIYVYVCSCLIHAFTQTRLKKKKKKSMEFLRSFEDDTNQEDQEVNIIGRILNFLESRIRFACGLIDSEEGINQVVSIIICSILHLLKTPMRFAGGVTEHILNLLSHNGSLTFLILKLCFCPCKLLVLLLIVNYNLHFNGLCLIGNVAFPIRETVNFVSPVGQLDGRKDLDEYNLASVASRVIDFWRQKQRRPLLDLCMMSAKLVYENELVVKTVVLSKWKASSPSVFLV